MKIRCNFCMHVFNEEDILIEINPEFTYEEEQEVCPYCRRTGYLMDFEETEEELL